MDDRTLLEIACAEHDDTRHGGRGACEALDRIRRVSDAAREYRAAERAYRLALETAGAKAIAYAMTYHTECRDALDAALAIIAAVPAPEEDGDV